MRPSAPPAFRLETEGSPFRNVLSASGVLLAAALLTGCPTPPTPKQKANEAADELNDAARWGRLDVAAGRSAPNERDAFLKRHAGWNNGLRIVDTELAGLSLDDPVHATVRVDVSWLFDDDTTLRVTRLEQKWSDAEGNWVMESEKRIGGALGLFGEKIDRGDKKKDTHFPTRTIR